MKLLLVSSFLYVCTSLWNNPPSQDGFSWNLVLDYFSKIYREDSSFIKILREFGGILYKNLCIFIIISHWIILKRRNVLDKFVETIKTRSLCSITFFFRKSCHLWGSLEKHGRIGQATDDIIIWCMRLACWITKTTDTHSEYVILIVFTARSLRERPSVFQVHCLFMLFISFHIFILTQ